jgi:hypothetical protein
VVEGVSTLRLYRLGAELEHHVDQPGEDFTTFV